MNGYQITSFTQQDRRHRHKRLEEWLMLAARDLGVRGATIFAASEGYGSTGGFTLRVFSIWLTSRRRS